MSKIVRNVTAAALIGFTPLSATIAAVRPIAAVPAAASSSAVTQQDGSTGLLGLGAGAIVPFGVIIATLTLGFYIAASKSDNAGRGVISRG